MDVDINEHQQYYDKYWTSHEQRLNSHEIVRLAEILQAIASIVEIEGLTPLRICDLGCGRGWLANELSKFGTVTAVDLSVVGVETAKRKWGHIDFRVADITKWRPADRFNLVVTSEVIEHVPDQQGFAQTVQHLLRDGGYLILTTPNRKLKKAWDKGKHGKQLVEQWLSPPLLRQLFGEADCVAHKTFIFDFAYTGILRVTSAPKLIRALDAIGMKQVYDALRNSLGMGLYQIFIGRYERRV